MPRVPLRRDGQDNRRREGDPVCGSPSLHRCLRMRAGIFSHKDLPQGRRGARPEGKREGGRKGAGGPEPLRMHSQKNPVKTECANIIVRFRKNETRKNHTRIPDDDGKNRLCEKPVFPIARHVPHPGSKPREIGGGFVWRRKYAAAIDRRTDCRGGGVPSLFAGSSYRTEKRKCIRKHTLSRVRRIGQNDRKPGDSAPGECRRNSPGKRTDIRPSAVRTSRFGRLDAVSVRMSAQPEERASATRCRQGFRRPFPEAPDTNSNSPTILP